MVRPMQTKPSMTSAVAAAAPSRRFRRLPVELPALVLAEDHRGRPATVVDVSRGGARVQTRFSVGVGARLTLLLYGFAAGPIALQGQVVHSSGVEAGIRFEDCADLPRLAALLEGLRA